MIGTASYASSKLLCDILAPLTGTTDYCVRNTYSLVEDLREVSISNEEMLVSFDVKSLYTNIPVEDTLCIIREKLDNDPSLPDRTSLSPASICKLLSSCLKTTSFRFRDTFYKLTDGVAMGSPVSAVVANLFMEHFEAKAIAQSLIKPALWKRFVDDVLAIMQRKACDDFLLLSKLSTSQHHLHIGRRIG